VIVYGRCWVVVAEGNFSDLCGLLMSYTALGLARFLMKVSRL
jgi:hypothetical protein